MLRRKFPAYNKAALCMVLGLKLIRSIVHII